MSRCTFSSISYASFHKEIGKTAHGEKKGTNNNLGNVHYDYRGVKYIHKTKDFLKKSNKIALRTFTRK